MLLRYVRSMDELHRLNSTSDSVDEPFGSPRQRPARRERLGVRRFYGSNLLLVDLVASVVLTVVQAVASGFLIFWNMFLGFAFDACGDPNPACNFTLGTGALFVVPVVAVVVFAGTVALVVKNRSTSRLSWWIPVAGIGVTVVSLVVAMTVMSIAVGRPIS